MQSPPDNPLYSPQHELNALYKEFQHAFEKFYDALCKYAYSFLKDHENCEDIVQDVFVRVWETRKDLIGTENFKYYLYTAVRNNSLTHLNKAKRMAVSSLSDRDIEEHSSPLWPIPTAEDLSDRVDYKALLQKAIEHLPPKCKEVFLLSRMGKFSNLEIADQLGVSLKTVNNQNWKAMKILRAYAKKNQIGGLIIFLYFF